MDRVFSSVRPKPIKGEPAQGKDSQFLAVVGNLVGREAWISWILFVCLLANQNPDPLAKNDCFTHSVFPKGLSKDGGVSL